MDQNAKEVWITMLPIATYSENIYWINIFINAFNTLRPRQMAAISQITFSNEFSWMRMHKFRLLFHWRLFLRFELTIFQHWFRKCLGAGQATSHYLNQWWLVNWCIYASLGLNELKKYSINAWCLYINIECRQRHLVDQVLLERCW